jgi:zinc transport system substrate-binding protein
MGRKLLLLLAFCWGLPAVAAPKVVVSILPLHSLVAGVMEGVGTPQLLIGANASPHDYALKPSDARALSEAELVVWVGEGMETMLEQPLQALAGKARVLELSTVEGMRLLPSRKGGAWEADEHGDHGEVHGGHGHAHGETDSHLWLSPHNARRIVGAVAEQLSALDTGNAARYQANAAALDKKIAALGERLQAQLAPFRERPYIVFHDAYHYFEDAFGLHPAGAIAVSPERRPGARRIVEIRQAIRDSGAACVFSEPQFRPAIVDVVLEGSGARHGVLDPLGSTLPAGKGQWFALMQGLADSLTGCLTGAS